MTTALQDRRNMSPYNRVPLVPAQLLQRTSCKSYGNRGAVPWEQETCLPRRFKDAHSTCGYEQRQQSYYMLFARSK